MDRTTERNRAVIRRAAERLLAWGFSPRSIADQLDCSVSWVYTVRRDRARSRADVEEQYVSIDMFLPRTESVS